MTLQALIFDFDGLIVDTETPGFASWQELYQGFDRALKLEDWTHATGYVGGFDPGRHLEKLLGRRLDGTELARKRDARNWELTLQAAVLPGIEELMRSAKAHQLPLGVASNSGTGWVEDGLTRLGLRDMIDVVITRDMVLRPKPAPDIYLKTAQTLRGDPESIQQAARAFCGRPGCQKRRGTDPRALGRPGVRLAAALHRELRFFS